jgi:nucleoid DNA-binding protein
VSKSGLIGAISTTTTWTTRGTGNAVNASVDAVVNEVRAGRSVPVDEFDRFNPTQRGPRMRRHPQTAHVHKLNGGVSLPARATSSAFRWAPARTTAASPVGKVARHALSTQVAQRAPARKTAKRSANKAVRRAPANRPAKYAPARKTAKRSAKKAVRRA